jgi:hypothetical protein
LNERQLQQGNALIHHFDGGSQYVCILRSERVAQAGIEPLVVSKGDSYENALAETITDCLSPSATFPQPNLKKITTGNQPVRPS